MKYNYGTRTAVRSVLLEQVYSMMNVCHRANCYVITYNGYVIWNYNAYVFFTLYIFFYFNEVKIYWYYNSWSWWWWVMIFWVEEFVCLSVCNHSNRRNYWYKLKSYLCWIEHLPRNIIYRLYNILIRFFFPKMIESENARHSFFINISQY